MRLNESLTATYCKILYLFNRKQTNQKTRTFFTPPQEPKPYLPLLLYYFSPCKSYFAPCLSCLFCFCVSCFFPPRLSYFFPLCFFSSSFLSVCPLTSHDWYTFGIIKQENIDAVSFRMMADSGLDTSGSLVHRRTSDGFHEKKSLADKNNKKKVRTV